MTSLVYSDEYRKHNTGNHPENQERLDRIVNSLKNEGMWNNVISPQVATEEDLLRVHTESHVQYIKKFCQSGGGYIDYDTFASPQSYDAALVAAGGAMKAAQIALSENAYSLARPPGHHATRDKSMGFCIFNNLAVALEYLRRENNVKKFLIFDFDVHFGNGTSSIFYDDPDVLYISIHQNPRTLYPGTGFINEIGIGEGEGCNLNIPMEVGSTTDDYIYMIDQILQPVASKFGADFYFLDVGFDGHVDDPLSGLGLTDDFYQYIIYKMKSIAKSMALILEGGYNLNVLSRCNVKMIGALNGLGNGDYNKHSLKVKDSNQITLNTIKDTFSPFYDF